MGQLVAALGASHNPHLLLPVERWEEVFEVLSPAGVPDFVRKGETLARAREVMAFSERCFADLKRRLDAAEPDTLVVIANDQGVNFFSFVPTFAVYVGRRRATGSFGPHRFDYVPDWELAETVLDEAMDRQFDVAFMEEIRLQHTQNVPLYYLVPPATSRKISILPVFVNTYMDPMPTAERCHAFGQMLRGAIARSGRRVAVLATGGLSHFPGSTRIGEIDEAFDRWAIEQMEAGRSAELAALSSKALRDSGNIELRNWITLLGVVGEARARIAYMPSLWAVTGLAFGHWELPA
jgi:aromatic ring-opening dioxygenase LigB subunit